MTFVVDWALDPTPSLTVVTEEVMEDVQPMLGPGGVCVTVTGAVVVSEPRADRLRWTEPDGRSFLVGGVPGLADGSPWEAWFRHPLGLAAAPDGSVVVADTDNHAIRLVAPDGWVTTLAGGTYGATDGKGVEARFRHPQGVAVAPDGTVVVADTVSNTVRKVDADGTVTTFAGGAYGQGDLQTGEVSFRRPEAVVVGPDGTIYVADTGNDRVVSIGPSARARTVAGRRSLGLPSAPAPDLRWPTSLALADGTLYITDAARNVVRRVSRDGTSTVSACEPAWRPVALSLFPNGRVLVAEAQWAPGRTTGRLRTIDP
jgi:hypothetical protein